MILSAFLIHQLENQDDIAWVSRSAAIRLWLELSYEA